MQYISTKYHGPTNHRGSRVIATTSSGTKHTSSYNHEWSAERNHQEAAKALALGLNWHGQWAVGHANAGNVYVLLPYRGEQDGGFIIGNNQKVTAAL